MTTPTAITTSSPRYGFMSLPYCSKCNNRYSAWIARSRFVKMFLFWLPLKRYYCSHCNSKTHLLRFSPFKG